MVELKYENDTLEAGRLLAHPEPGEEIVITGTSGSFPDSDGVTEFGENLFKKVDLISGDGRRWLLDHPEIPQRTGKLLDISKFDAGFFGIHYKQANAMDPMCRILMEKVFEAVVDAGMNPSDLRGRKVGVYVGACFSETEKTWFYEKLQVNGFGVTGCARAMLANRVSYWLGLKGPSYTIDTACSSSLYALEHGYRAIREGQCEAAIVAGTNLCLHPYVSLQFCRLGVLSKDGACKCFDESANGYCRSEAVSVMILQKAKEANRIYATIVHAKTNCDGYKEQGITFPSGPLQQTLLEEFYEECQIDPASLAWVEAHGTGTKVGDPEEIKAIEKVFCPNRKGPLKIGSLKSNAGHSEPASGLLSVTKVIIAMETGFIPPNINFNTPRKDISALHNGKISVITEKTAWEGGMVGVNSFGFGGANCHVLLKWNEKSKVNGGLPKDDLPRIVTISGRTHEAMQTMLDYLDARPLDAEYVNLYHNIFRKEIPGHLFRGYTLLSKKGPIARGIKESPSLLEPIWYLMPGVGTEWNRVDIQGLTKIPLIASILTEVAAVLKPLNFDLIATLTKCPSEDESRKVIKTCIIQIVLGQFLKTLKAEPDNVIGVSYGEIAAGLASGCFTLKESVLLAYYASQIVPTSTQYNAIAIVGVSGKEVRKMNVNGVKVVLDSSRGSVISGSEQSINQVIQKVKKMNELSSVLAVTPKLDSSSHQQVKSKLLAAFQKVIPGTRTRPAQWPHLSANPTKEMSAEILVDTLMENVDNTFGVISSVLSQNANIVNFSTDQYNTEPLCKKYLNANQSVINILSPNEKDIVNNLLESLGKMYEIGLHFELTKLYPNIKYPVSRTTPMISPLIKWDHSEDWYVSSYKSQDQISTGERCISISLEDDEQEYISGHLIDGRNLYPATGYLFLVWESFALMNAKFYPELPVVFENIKFTRATNLTKDAILDFYVTIQRCSGNFEIVESGAAIVTGRVYIPEDVAQEMTGLSANKSVEPSDPMFIVTPKDIYKELRLRGYQYKGLFRSMTKSNLDGSIGFIQWHNNWVAFMDNMLQIQILQCDTRGLFVPTGIAKIIIDPQRHLEIANSMPEGQQEIPVYNYKHVKMLSSGGIEIRGMNASAISRRKQLGEPVLENYLFLPNEPPKQIMQTEDVVRAYIHLALENIPSINVKVVERGDYNGPSDIKYLAPSVIVSLADLPLMQPEVAIFAENGESTDGLPSEIIIEEKKMPSDQSALISIGFNLFAAENAEKLKSSIEVAKENGFIINRSLEDFDQKVDGLEKCSVQIVGQEYISLYKKIQMTEKFNTVVVRVREDNFDWLKVMQEALKSSEVDRVIMLSEGDPLSGILGFSNCILKEGFHFKARCFFLMDPKAPKFSLDNPLYKAQIQKDLTINIFKDGCWGSYRHVKLPPSPFIESPHAYIGFLTRGDISSATWIKGNLGDTDPLHTIQVYYSALNFRDIMTGTGKLAPEVVEKSRLEQDCVQGLEFSGRCADGRRVMGIVPNRGIANAVSDEFTLMWTIPDSWTLEEAATVPCVYATIIYAFDIVGNMKPGETVLIHAGSGGVGQAAIHYALFFGCKVYTTVGTPEKRDFLKKTFPQLTDNVIGNSRDTSFEQMIMRETNGRGVDIVMNSLAEEKLLASVRCLAKGGRFLELGKFDIANNNPLGMEFLLRNASFHGIMLTVAFKAEDVWKQKLWAIIDDKLRKGAVKPFSRIVFEKDQVEQAIRYMAAGKHIGKVLIKIRDEEPTISAPAKPYPMMSQPRFYCKSQKTYVIIGGLGGFGLELADWLALRKAKKLVLSSRNGVVNGYQAYRIKLWKSYGVEVSVFTGDITTEKGVLDLLTMANNMGPVGGIFNLAVVLRDAIFENQNEEEFKISLKPKAIATKLLDSYSRKLCPELEQFVVFSSVSCGRGNAGQTNYGMSNSVMERVCELRAADGLPACAIQWGAVGDVGLVANMQEDNTEVVIGGTLPQKIDSCLGVMDIFLNQKYTLVASMVVAEKKAGMGGADNIVDTVVNIIGLRDLKSVSMHSTLAELGMDSMMAVEIKQTLEREFEVFLTPQDIRAMTFAKLHDIASSKSEELTNSDESNTDRVKAGKSLVGIMNLIRSIGEESLAEKPVIKLQSGFSCGDVEDISNDYSNKLFLLPGLEGFASIFENLAALLNFETLCVQYDYKDNNDTIDQIATVCYERMKPYISKKHVVRLVIYSYGGVVGMHLATKLEKLGYTVKLCVIDASPELLKDMVISSLDMSNDDNVQIKLLLNFIELMKPHDKSKAEPELKEATDWESRMKIVLGVTKSLNYTENYKRALMTCIYKRLKALHFYSDLTNDCINCPLILIKPKDNVMMTSYDGDYGLSKFTKVKDVKVHIVEGNHMTMLDNIDTASYINASFIS